MVLILLSLPFESEELMLSGLRPEFLLSFHGEITVVVYGRSWKTPADEEDIPGKDSAILDDVAPAPSSDTLVTVRFLGVYANCFSGEG